MAIAEDYLKGRQRIIYGDDADRLTGKYDGAGNKFYSMDTDIAWLYDGNGWLTFSTLGSQHVTILDADGNAVGSLGGALNVHDADVHNVPVNEYFHRHTGVSTNLAAATTGGVTSTIVIDSPTGFAIGNDVQLQNGVIETTHPRITNIIAGTQFVLDRPIDTSFSIGDIVDQIEIDMAVLGSLASPISFKVISDSDQIWHIVRFLLGMVHTGAADDSKFGDIAALTNGVTLRGYNGTNDAFRTFTNWKSNADIKMDMFNVEYSDKAGGGAYGTNARGSIKIGTGAVPVINSAAGDYLEILVQDDLTALTSFRLKAQGHIEGL